MKYVWYILAAVVVLGLIWWVVQTQNAEAPVEEDTTEEVTDTPATTEETTEGDPSAEDDAADEEDIVVIDLTGKPFEFSQTEIRVQQGDRVRINFESTEGLHDWVVDEFNAATDQVMPGTPTSVEFVADQAGEFEYYCSVGQHRENGMVGTLIVEEA
jgi:plastocyanin